MMTTLGLRASLVLSAVAVVSAAVQGAEVRGRISGDGGKPVARAVVRLLQETPPPPKGAKPLRVETGDDGAFVASGLTGGGFKLRVEAKGYAPLTQNEIPAGASVQLRLRPGTRLSGILKDREKGTLIAAATVLAWDKAAEPFGEEAYRSAKSGKDGRFVIADLPEGKVTAEARAAGRAPARSPNVAVPKADFELLLDLAGGLTGSVTDTAGDPVPGAEVAASWRVDTGMKRRGVKTGADGRYRIQDAVTEALSRVAVKAAKFLDAERDGPAPQDGVVDFVLERGGSIAAVVRGHDGKVPPTFRVSVRRSTAASGGGKGEHDFNDSGGSFRVDDLTPGTYTIEVSADPYATVKKEDVEIAAERVEDLGTLTLPSRSMLRGRVVAARDRAAVSGATVRLALVDSTGTIDPAASSSWTASSGVDGTFTTPVLPAGTLELAAEHPQFAPARIRVEFRPDADSPEVVVEMFRGGVLTGRVLDDEQEPVSGVRIVATQGTEGESRGADTASDGQYYMDGLAPGTWTVTRQEERQPGAVYVDTKLAAIKEGETTTVDFDEKAKVSVSGLVMKGDQPIPNASIYFVAIDRNLPRDGKSTKADAEGRYQVGLLHGGRYQVSVVFGVSTAANGHNVTTLNIPEQPDVRQDIVFMAQAITGRVVDPERKGVKGALVTAARQGTAPGDSPRHATTMTVDNGSFRLDAVDEGTYRVTARAKAYASAEEFPVVVSPDMPEPELLMTLQRGWIMRGRVLDPQGRGVAGALVVVAPDGAAESGYLPAQSDASGGFRITAPVEGPVNVAAISSRFAPAVQTGVSPQGEGGGPEIVLNANAGGAMRIRVVRRGGDPVVGVQVAYQPTPLFPGCDVVMDRNRAKPTAGDGTTELTLLYPGAYLVSIPGRRDAPTIQVFVNDGAEAEAVLELP